jgi:hypothetical protein
MKVNQVVAIAKEWVEETASQVPGLNGAYLAGSINRLERDAPFPGYKDVDVCVIVEDTSLIPLPKARRGYKGILLDAEFQNLEEYRSAEAVLSSPEYALNLVAGRILSDPHGLLSGLQQLIEKEYPRRRWVRARCGWEKRVVAEHLGAINPPTRPNDMFSHLIWVVLGLGGLVTVAQLRPPTVRRCLVLSKGLLEAQGRPDLHEALLQLLGSAHLEQDDVKACLEECIRAFNRAVEVVCNPIYGVHRDSYAYLVEGSREMMDQGHHREAMFWITMMHFWSNTAVQTDAPEEERARYQTGFDRTASRLGLRTADEWRARQQLGQEVAAEIFTYADGVVMRCPE